MLSNKSISEYRLEALKMAAKKSSRYPFIAEHRGGPLSKENHHKLMRWAIECSEHVLSLIDSNIDKRLSEALHIAQEWKNGNLPTGAAIKASVAAHAAARESTSPVSIAVARSIGQTVATAHFADHSMGAALFALKAVKIAGKSVDQEREWQNNKLHKLPQKIEAIVLDKMKLLEKISKI